MTKYRAVANGNILDVVPEGLVAAGIYEPVDDDGAAPEQATKPAPEPEAEPEADEDTQVEPMKADDMPTPKKKAKKKGK